MNRALAVVAAACFVVPCVAQEGSPKTVPATKLVAPGEGPAEKAAQPAETSPQKVERPSIYNASADAKAEIAKAVSRAKAENRRVLIQYGADWCGWCHLLHGTFKSDAAIKRELQYEYDVVLVDIGRFDRNMEIAEGYGADLKKNGVPFLTVLDSEGKPVANQETGSLEVKGEQRHDPAKVLAFLKQHKAEYQKADDLLAAALVRATSEKKPVFLHFGAPWCIWCHRMEAWMAREDVHAILSKHFVDLKIDEDRTIGGKELELRYSETAKGIPWFAFLSPEGKAMTTSDGPKGNVGFPVAPEEIAHFVSMLKGHVPSLSAAEVATLEATLKEEGKKYGQ